MSGNDQAVPRQNARRGGRGKCTAEAEECRFPVFGTADRIFVANNRLLRPWRYLQIDFISEQVGIRSSRLSHADAPADALAIGDGFG